MKASPYRLLRQVVGIILLLGLAWQFLMNSAAQALVQHIEESPGQMLSQSRQTIRDQHNQAWQVIAFQRIKAGENDLSISHPYLRLVGFPGQVSIDQEQPITLTNALGTTLSLPPATRGLFTDELNPEPHIAQYDLGAGLEDINVAIPVEVKIPTTTGTEIRLNIGPTALYEWQHLRPQQSN